MTQCNSCEGVGVNQTLPSTISAKTLAPLPNRLRSFGVWSTFVDGSAAVAVFTTMTNVVTNDNQHFSQQIKQDDIQSERITTCREAGRALKCGKVRWATASCVCHDGRRSTHTDTQPCELTSPVDYDQMIFSQLKLKGFKIMTKTKTKWRLMMTHNMSWQRRLNLR